MAVLKFSIRFNLSLVVAFTLMLVSCENDLNKVKQIAAQESTNPVDTTKGVDIIYSDSARVKAHLLTPLLLTFNAGTTKSYYQMPQGVKITFYDKNLQPSSSIKADFAFTAKSDNIIELHRNVVVSNIQGDSFKSSELIWDRLKKVMYCNAPFVMDRVDGTHINGINFKSDESFSNDYTFQQGHGTIATKGNLAN